MTTNAYTQMPPEGWYPDPVYTGGRRYWTGTEWGHPPKPSRKSWLQRVLDFPIFIGIGF